MQLDEYGAAARGVQVVAYPRNERERTVMLNERSDAREAIIALAASEGAALGIIAALGLDNDDELLNMAVAEPVPSDASPAGFGECVSGECSMCFDHDVTECGFVQTTPRRVNVWGTRSKRVSGTYRRYSKVA